MLGALAAFGCGAGGAWAGPITIGGLAPAGATLTDCKVPPGPNEYRSVDQQSEGAGGPTYVVPAPGGTITSWSSESISGGNADLLLLTPGSNPSRTVMYNLASAGGTAYYRTSGAAQQTVTTAKVYAPAGTEIALLGFGGVSCSYATSDSADVVGSTATSPPFAGSTLNYSGTAQGRADVSAVVNTDADMSLRPSSVPAPPGSEVHLTVHGEDAGPSPGTATVTGTLPPSMQLLGATLPPQPSTSGTSNEAGTCHVSGQSFSCSQFVVPTNVTVPGRNAPDAINIDLDVRATGQGSFTATITSDHPDPNPGNSTAPYEVFPPPGTQTGGGGQPAGPAPLHPASACHVPRLAGHTLKSARRLLKRGHCKLGRVSGKAKRGYVVVSSFPPALTYVPPTLPVSLHLGKRHKAKARHHR